MVWRVAHAPGGPRTLRGSGWRQALLGASAQDRAQTPRGFSGGEAVPMVLVAALRSDRGPAEREPTFEVERPPPQRGPWKRLYGARGTLVVAYAAFRPGSGLAEREPTLAVERPPPKLWALAAIVWTARRPLWCGLKPGRSVDAPGDRSMSGLPSMSVDAGARRAGNGVISEHDPNVR